MPSKKMMAAGMKVAAPNAKKRRRAIGVFVNHFNILIATLLRRNTPSVWWHAILFAYAYKASKYIDLSYGSVPYFEAK